MCFGVDRLHHSGHLRHGGASAVIVAEINLLSAQGSHRDKKQARIEIANEGGTRTQGYYHYKITGKAGQKLAEGHVGPFPRKTLLAIDLLAICLVDARGERIMREYK
jgi:hypothetical protein